MTPFLSKDFLLKTETAKHLYHDIAAQLPILDYHCHVSPKEIFENKRFKNITEVWLSGDHYKWRLMRSNGIDEYYITGDAPDREKFQKFAETLPKAIGNPMYHWCHLELKNYFGYEGILNGETTQKVWDLTCQKLSQPELSVRGIIKKSNVALIGTTDDPIDSLEWHKKLMEDDSFSTIVAPTFRPDKALNIEKADWKAYIATLSQVSGVKITDVESLKVALAKRIDHFDSCGCRASDHGLDYMVFRPVAGAAEGIMAKALAGNAVTMEEAEIFKTELLLFCAEAYARKDWVLQLHYNCLRNPNSKEFSRLGPDMGFDSIGPRSAADTLPGLLDALYSKGCLPKTVLYSLDAGDNAFLDVLMGAFQGTEVPGKIQHGSAWWFNDNKVGMEQQLISLGNLGILGNFIGMLTDSRSFLSYTRHEYFRRILCNLVGQWVEDGEYPNSEQDLQQIISGICYENAKRYFNI